jgi:hypothetical protein
MASTAMVSARARLMAPISRRTTPVAVRAATEVAINAAAARPTTTANAGWFTISSRRTTRPSPSVTRAAIAASRCQGLAPTWERTLEIGRMAGMTGLIVRAARRAYRRRPAPGPTDQASPVQ